MRFVWDQGAFKERRSVIRLFAALMFLSAGAFAIDPILSPGDVLKVTAHDVCSRGYAKKARHVSAATKRQVYAMYKIPFKDRQFYVIDHVVPLSIGGSNRILNLAPQLKEEAKQKDRAENILHWGVCHGQIELDEAQKEIAGNWRRVLSK